MRAPRFQDEAGLTLVETVITVALLGIVIGPLTVSMLFGLVYSSGTRDRIADSGSAQLASSYLPPDIQSAETVALSGGGCPSSPEPSDDVRLQFTWNRPKTSAPAATAVAYFTRPTADGDLELHRAQCTAGEPETETLLVQHLKAIDVTCDGGACVPSPPPREVTVTLGMFNPDSGSEIYDGSEHVITATRRTEP